MIFLSKISYKGTQWIKLDFAYNRSFIDLIKSIDSSYYSRSMKAWLIPYTKTAFTQFKNLGLTYKLPDHTGTTGNTLPKSDHTGTNIIVTPPKGVKEETNIDARRNDHQDINIRWNNMNFYIRLPYDKENVQFLKSLPGTWWNKKYGNWVVKTYPDTLTRLQKRFSYWSKDQFWQLNEVILKTCDPCTLELYSSPQFPKSFLLRITGHRADFSFVKNVPERRYDKQYKRWILPFDSKVIDRIKAYYTERGVKIIDRLPKKKAEYTRQETTLGQYRDYLIEKSNPKHHKPLTNLLNTLIKERYSRNTMRAYHSGLVKYLEYLGDKAIENSTAEEVNQLLVHIASKKISNSLLNNIINAIKFYFTKVIYVADFEIQKIWRPRKIKTLPVILSVQEVDRLLRATNNVKHACLMYAIYSTGMRLSEILALRLQDCIWDRNQVYIRNSKGNKDRVVMFSKILKDVMIRYIEMYKPEYWLFEGQDKKKQYSRQSVLKVIKKAAANAGITRKVTTHVLRHCFATHLMDNVTDLRYIQELLGHKDIKTTLIYTHVTTRSVTNIESPLDTMYKNRKDLNNDNL